MDQTFIESRQNREHHEQRKRVERGACEPESVPHTRGPSIRSRCPGAIFDDSSIAFMATPELWPGAGSPMNLNGPGLPL